MGGVGSGHLACSWSSAGPEGQWAWGAGYPSKLWDRLQAGVQCRLVVGILVVVGPAARLRGGHSGLLWPGQLRDRYPDMCGHSPGVESPAEWSSSSANLQGRDLAGLLFLY
jgi:hypothetical protein